MDARIVEFGALLRQSGLRVSPAETLDALGALAAVGLGDRSAFREALRATMVKRSADLPTFDELFDLYFSALGQAVREASEATVDAVAGSEEEFRDLLARLDEMLKAKGRELSDLARALLENDDGTLERQIREAKGRASAEMPDGSMPEGRMGHALAREIGLGELTDELAALQAELEAGGTGMDDETAAKLRELIRRRLADLAEMLKRTARIEAEQRDPKRRDATRSPSLAEKSFYYLTEDEIRRMKEAVTRLARRLKNVVSIRRTRARRGTFDLQKTLRRSTRYGGIPFEIELERRRKDRPQIVILCDVSDSVRNVSRFMMQFVYSLQDLYTKVRSFVFVADIGEVTRLFEDHEIGEAVDLALRGDVINVFAHSDFGRAFKGFHRDHLAAINGRTTVIILGDARNNYNLPHEWVLRDVQKRAKQVIWLNPENRTTWGFGDSEMDRYGRYCDVVEECRNLNQLYRVVDRLVTA